MTATDEAMKTRRFGPRLVTPAGPPSPLKELRFKLGLTQAEAAAWADQLIPCKHVTWVKWENNFQGREAPPIILRLMEIMVARKSGGTWTPEQIDMLDQLLQVQHAE